MVLTCNLTSLIKIKESSSDFGRMKWRRLCNANGRRRASIFSSGTRQITAQHTHHTNTSRGTSSTCSDDDERWCKRTLVTYLGQVGLDLRIGWRCNQEESEESTKISKTGFSDSRCHTIIVPSGGQRICIFFFWYVERLNNFKSQSIKFTFDGFIQIMWTMKTVIFFLFCKFLLDVLAEWYLRKRKKKNTKSCT